VPTGQVHDGGHGRAHPRVIGNVQPQDLGVEMLSVDDCL
jgi:hypothetical protein